MTVSLKDITDAKTVLKPHIISTPLVRLHQLDHILGCKVYAKLENMQRTKSFKIRGAMNKLESLNEKERNAGVIASSSGNHGHALSYAAKKLDIEATVVIPETAPDFKIEAIKEHGARTEFCTVDNRFQVTEELAERYGYTIVPPFDDDKIIAGQGTVGLELMESDIEFDQVIVPTSGGGLLGGVATALKESGFTGEVTGAEPDILPRYSESLTNGRRTRIDSRPTIADALVVNQPGELNFPIVRKYADDILTVSDDYMLKAQKMMLMEGKILAEVSSCIGMGAAMGGKLNASPSDKICFVVSGGNLGFGQLEYLKEV